MRPRAGRRGGPGPAAAVVLAIALLSLPVPGRGVEVERVVSAGGIEAWLVRDHSNPIVTARLAFRGGAALDPDGKEGLATLVADLLDEGAGPLDSQAFQTRREDLAVGLRFDAGFDTMGGQVRTLRENLAEAFDLARLALTAPRFDDDALTRVRSRMTARLRRELEEPNAIARRTLAHRLLPDHPYGRPAQGTPEGLVAIAPGDLRRFVAERFARDALVVGVVGDIDGAELAPLLDATFGSLPARATPWVLAEAHARESGKTVVVRKGVPQSVIVFGQEGVRRHDPDFYAAFVLNHVLGGGGFTSRLYGEIREKRGLAYSVYSGLNPLASGALLLGGAATANARAADTVRLIREQWARIAQDGVGEDELTDAKMFLTGSFPLRFTASDRIASMLVDMQLDDLGIDYLERRNRLIEDVTLAQVNRLARRLLAPERLTVVVVGEPAGLAGED